MASINFSPSTKASINKFQKAVEVLGEQFEEFKEYSDNMEKLLENQANLKEEIEGIEFDLQEKKRRAHIELELYIKEQKDNALESLADELGIITLSGAEYSNLKEAANLTEKAIETAVNSAKAEVYREKDSEITQLKYKHAADTADLNAKVSSQADMLQDKEREIARLTAQIERMNETLQIASTGKAITQQIGKV